MTDPWGDGNESLTSGLPQTTLTNRHGVIVLQDKNMHDVCIAEYGAKFYE